jgi:hypothetical protein
VSRRTEQQAVPGVGPDRAGTMAHKILYAAVARGTTVLAEYRWGGAAARALRCGRHGPELRRPAPRAPASARRRKRGAARPASSGAGPAAGAPAARPRVAAPLHTWHGRAAAAGGSTGRPATLDRAFLSHRCARRRALSYVTGNAPQIALRILDKTPPEDT